MSWRSAQREALKSKVKQHRLGAVVVKNGRVLGTGYNEYRYTKELGYPTLHAEEAAILSLLKTKRLNDLAGAELYVTRFTPSGATGCSKPCSRCSDLIQAVGIREVHYLDKESNQTSYRV